MSIRRIAIRLIRFYQRSISSKTPPSCRFVPTCSEYAAEAIERFGLLRGGAMAAWRILRCNPFGKPGYDPVPQQGMGGRRKSHENPGGDDSADGLNA